LIAVVPVPAYPSSYSTTFRARSTGEYHPGNHGGIETVPRYGKYFLVEIKEEMAGRHTVS
jgi:hypothetical protein